LENECGSVVGLRLPLSDTTHLGAQFGLMFSLTDGLGLSAAKAVTEGAEVGLSGGGTQIKWKAVLEQSLGRNVVGRLLVGSEGLAVEGGFKW
jgi:hypothetical protein